MKRFVNEEGLTLIELLTALTIASLIFASAYGVFLSGIKAYKRIGIENQLRSEADYVIATIMNELYRFAPDGIDTASSTNDTASSTNERITFIKNKQKVIDPDIGLVEEKKVNEQTLTIELQNETISLNGQSLNSDNLKIVSAESSLSYHCVRQEGTVCRSGIVTIVLSVQDRDHDSKDDLLYIEPFSLKTEFGF
ncbi:PilW family protein [Thermolongibacillus altinsuensis]|jgi:prepilin-type N-terminal cleavage/methylation domain-containing protein